MSILVTGGAGYIGSNMVRTLVSSKKQVVVIDSLEFGHPESLPLEAEFINGNVGDEKFLEDVFSHHTIEAVIHFAGYTSVPESVKFPEKYFQNNLVSPTTLLRTMVNHSVKHFIFSSTAATYGEPISTPIKEDDPKLPTNPYGLSKLAFEQLLSYYDRQFGIKSISLRYFNACGASPDGNYGEDHQPEGHIIPIAIKMAMQNKQFTIFGNDFPTPDGTCIRDYIHIDDLCSAHSLALDALKNGHQTDVFNVGTGKGTSNLQIANTVKDVTHTEFPINFGPRREGDPAELVADSTKLQKRLNWTPTSSDIATIISHAYRWHSTHPNGYSR